MSLKFSRQLHFILFFFTCFAFFSQNIVENESKFEKITSLSNPKEQYFFYIRSTIYSNNYVKNINDWITYFEQKSEDYRNTEESLYVNFMLVHLFRISSKLEKAIELGVETYYLNSEKKVHKNLLCNLLQELETCYYLKNNNLELIRLNKEKFKICGKNEGKLFNIYFNMGLYDLALKDYRENINFGKPSYKKHDLYAQAFHNNDFGVYFMYDNKIDSALYYYNKANLLFKKQKQKDSSYRSRDVALMLGVVDGNISTCLLKQGNYKQAIPGYLNEIEACRNYYNTYDWFDSEKVYNRIAKCYIHTNQFKKADYYIEKLKKLKAIYFNLKGEYHTKLNNKDSTLFYYKKYMQISDSIFNQEMKQQKMESLGVLEVNAKLKSQEKKINLLEEKDNSKSKKIRVSLLISAIAIVFFLLVLYFYFGVKKKQVIVEFQKNKIEKALNNNSILLKELNHRVKNNLQMVSSVISLQASKIKDESSKLHFKSAINRVKVLSEIHNSLYSKNQLEEIDVLNYVAILKDYLVKSIINPDIKVDFIIDITPNLYLDNDKKTTIGLIINELVTNSFKYAFQQKTENVITITIRNEGNTCSFSYKDNGQGFDYKNLDKNKSIGINLILRLVNQLGEDANINAENGMQIHFNFKA
ncbi:histidine kinase dimerization/phosphoacceptor domain -containing protein [Polaribacter sp. R77954]|uniref:histidine kinase dimerization/phosphoacceptor domain -containing protein n=1 Tax=Polaribacter sp. R77954 TaxID=3093870 RepID=UPI0037C54E5E